MIDVLSRLTTATNPNGTFTIAHNNRSRVSSVTDVFGQVVSNAYDANSNRTQLSLGGATNASYQYDVLNRLTQLTDNASLAFTFAYDATNKLTSRSAPNGVDTPYQYDGLNRLTSLKYATGTTTVEDFQYQFNAVNNIAQITDAAGAHNYTYDTLDRLTAAMHPSQSNESYNFDDVGNRTTSHQGSSYSYQTFNRLVAANGSSFGYDTNGNLISKTDPSGNWTYTWDYENRLKQAALSSGVTVTYSYDALGRRNQRTSRVSGTTKFVYDGADVVRDLDANGSAIVDYANGPGIDNKLRQTTGGSVSYFVTDHLGTTCGLTDGSGSLLTSLSYDSFGNVTSGSAATRFTHTGHELDSDTGLVYYRARWYDPQQGRFVSEDPIGVEASSNLYGYVGNNPLVNVDPFGLQAQSIKPRVKNVTIGNTIYLDAGAIDRLDVRTASGLALLAHETWHALQSANNPGEKGGKSWTTFETRLGNGGMVRTRRSSAAQHRLATPIPDAKPILTLASCTTVPAGTIPDHHGF